LEFKSRWPEDCMFEPCQERQDDKLNKEVLVPMEMWMPCTLWKWIPFRQLGFQINAGKFSCRSIFKKSRQIL